MISVSSSPTDRSLGPTRLPQAPVRHTSSGSACHRLWSVMYREQRLLPSRRKDWAVAWISLVSPGTMVATALRLQQTRKALSGPQASVAAHSLSPIDSRSPLTSINHHWLAPAITPPPSATHRVTGVTRSISFIRSTPRSIATKSTKSRISGANASAMASGTGKRIGIRCAGGKGSVRREEAVPLKGHPYRSGARASANLCQSLPHLRRSRLKAGISPRGLNKSPKLHPSQRLYPER